MSALAQLRESDPGDLANRGVASSVVSDTLSNLILDNSMLPARLRFDPVWSDAELLAFAANNPLVRFEQESNGDILIMSPVGMEGTEHETDVALELGIWARQDGRGRSYNSNGGFRLPDKSMRAPDAAWMSWAKRSTVPEDLRSGYGPVCPEFILEVRSENDSLPKLRKKMDVWLANGAELAWLIDPQRKAVEIYRPGREPEIQEGHSAAYGEGPVGGFVQELARIWG